MQEQELKLFEPAAALRSQLSSGYKSYYAIGEIIDNSIEALADEIDIIFVEKQSGVRRKNWNVSQILILDNGTGMDKVTLQSSLTFGYGTHRETDKISSNAFKKMGKFGYGLPNSSVSQADDIHVWSWTRAIDEENLPLHTALNVPSILQGNSQTQEEVKPTKIPKEINKMLDGLGIKLATSGTLVWWNEINKDRSHLAKSSTVIKQVEANVGRIYRKFLSNEIQISLSVVRVNNDGTRVTFEKPRSFLKPNDPLFLTKDCLALARKLITEEQSPSFEKFDPHWDTDRKEMEIEHKGVISKLTITFARVKDGLRYEKGGNSEFGKFVNENTGVSVCRAGRELQLSKNWYADTDPRNRWMCVEIDFPPSLDDLFGVTNNKQEATAFDLMAKLDYESEIEAIEEQVKDSNSGPQERPSRKEIHDYLRESDRLDEWYRIAIAQEVKDGMKKMRQEIDAQKKPAPPATGGNGEGIQLPPESDRTEDHAPGKVKALTPEEKKTAIQKAAEEMPFSADSNGKKVTLQRIRRWLDTQRAFLIDNMRISGDKTIFGVTRLEHGRVVLYLNDENLGVKVLSEALDLENIENLTKEDLEKRLDALRSAVTLLIYSWAVVEHDGDYARHSEDRTRAGILRREIGYKFDDLMSKVEKEINS